MKWKDYYRILDIEPNASPEEIKKAYRKQARSFHPDVSKDDDSGKKFMEIGEAYEVLGDRIKKIHYDRMRRYRMFTEGGLGSDPEQGGALWEYMRTSVCYNLILKRNKDRT